MQKWRLSQHYAIPFWGLYNIYKILTAPNGTKFTICQVIMSIKLVKDLITLLFVHWYRAKALISEYSLIMRINS